MKLIDKIEKIIMELDWEAIMNLKGATQESLDNNQKRWIIRKIKSKLK